MYFYLDHKVSSTLMKSENNGQIILSKGRKGSFFNILRVKLYIYLAFLLKGILLIPLIGENINMGIQTTLDLNFH